MATNLYNIYNTDININQLDNSLEHTTSLALDNTNIDLTLFKYPRLGFMYQDRVMALKEDKYVFFNKYKHAIKYDSEGLVVLAVIKEDSNAS